MSVSNKRPTNLLATGIALIVTGAPVFAYTAISMAANDWKAALISEDITLHVVLLVLVPSFLLVVTGALAMASWRRVISPVWVFATLLPVNIPMLFWIVFFILPTPIGGVFALPIIGPIVVFVADYVLIKQVLQETKTRELLDS